MEPCALWVPGGARWSKMDSKNEDPCFCIPPQGFHSSVCRDVWLDPAGSRESENVLTVPMELRDAGSRGEPLRQKG